jgi:L-lactate dehydrogenase complex protein LldF
MGDWKHLSYASSLCGNCTEVCAVKINLHELLLENRHEAVEEGAAAFAEKMAWKGWKTAMLNRKLMNLGTGGMKGWAVNTFVKSWSRHRSKLDFPAQSFNELWQERNKKRP